MAGQLQRDLSQLGIANQGFHVISQDMLSLQCHTPKWYFSRREIEDHSPSRMDCIDLKTETQLRASYCLFLQDLGIKLKVPQVTIATAMMLCHRFYMRQSHAKNGWQTLATASMFLACKVEETPCLLMDIVAMTYEMMHRSDPAAAQRIKRKDVYQKQKELITTGERFLLTTIAFDLNIQNPYKPLVAALKRLKIPHNDLAKVAWNFVNDWLRTTLCLQYKPHYIAAGSMYLAAKILKVKLPSDRGKAWWLDFDVAPHQLEEVIKQMLGLLGHDRRLPMPSLNSKTKQASVGVKKAPSNYQQTCTVISSVTTCDSIHETETKPRGDGELRKSNYAYICGTQSFSEDTSDCAAKSEETPQFQTSDCGSSHSTVEDGNRSDEGEVHATTVVSNEITVIKIVSDCGGLGKIDKDHIKEALKKRRYCGLAYSHAAVTMEDTRDDDSWIVREPECGVELAYASEEERQKLLRM